MKHFIRSTKAKSAAMATLIATTALLATPSFAADQLAVRYVSQRPVERTTAVRPLRVGVPVASNFNYVPAGFMDRCIPLYRWVNRPGYGEFNGLWTRSC